MRHKGPANPEKSFGISVGIVLLLVAALLLWRGRTGGAEVAGGIGAALLVLGLVRPRWLKWPSKVWWQFAIALGHVNARILLTVAFMTVLVPIGALWRIIGRDPLGRSRAAWPGWSPYPERYRDRHHFTKMY